MVECTGLENRSSGNGTVSSNLTSSAVIKNKPHCCGLFFITSRGGYDEKSGANAELASEAASCGHGNFRVTTRKLSVTESNILPNFR